MTRASTNESCIDESFIYDFDVTALEIVLEAIITSTSVILNILLLVTVCCSRLLRTSMHISISSLAASDVLTAVYGLAQLTITAMADRACFSFSSWDHINKGLNITYLLNTFSGHMNILIVSGERWLFISRPFLYQRLISHSFAFVGVAVAWVFSVLVNLEAFMVTLENYMTLANIKSDIVVPCFHTVVIAGLFVIYVHLTIITRKQMHAINKIGDFRQPNNDDTIRVRPRGRKLKVLRENLKSIRLLVAFFGGYVFLLSPGVYYHLYVRFSPGRQEHPHIHEGLKLMSYFHTCVNFVVFVSLDKCFRRVLMTWLRKAMSRDARYVCQFIDTVSVCQGCRTGCKVDVDDLKPTVSSVTLTSRY